MVYLAERAEHVTMVVRRPLEATMSRYLIDRIGQLRNVDLVEGAEVRELEGNDGQLDAITWCDLRAVGDVRSGSVKRVASSVGDGAQVVAALHRVLANRRTIAGS